MPRFRALVRLPSHYVCCLYEKRGWAWEDKGCILCGDGGILANAADGAKDGCDSRDHFEAPLRGGLPRRRRDTAVSRHKEVQDAQANADFRDTVCYAVGLLQTHAARIRNSAVAEGKEGKRADGWTSVRTGISSLPRRILGSPFRG